jgi:hypothetical protein
MPTLCAWPNIPQGEKLYFVMAFGVSVPLAHTAVFSGFQTGAATLPVAPHVYL